ncbi:MAG TPA: PaaI family thioesterase [Puia sp.]|nr:PaaI family thioesterase [Puia sp.]
MDRLDPHIEQRLLDSFSRQPLMVAYGARITAIAKGFVEISVEPSDMLLRGGGLFHGGVITALADSAGGYSAAAHPGQQGSFLTVELKINFLKAAKGTRLVTRGKTIRAGRTLTIVQADSYIENDGDLGHVATALLTFIREQP